MSEAKNMPDVFHVRHYINEEMEARGWDRDTLAAMMGFKDARDFQVKRLSLDFLLDIEDPDMFIGDDLSADLGRAFGVSPQLFTNIDNTWRKHPSVRKQTVAELARQQGVA